MAGKPRSRAPKTLPIFLQGRVKRPATHPVFLAITVNGIITGFTRTVENGGDPLRFHALLPPEVGERAQPRIRVVPLRADWMRVVGANR